MTGTSLVVQWLRLYASTVGGTGLTPGRGIKIPHAAWCGQKKKMYDRTTYCLYKALRQGERALGFCQHRSINKPSEKELPQAGEGPCVDVRGLFLPWPACSQLTPQWLVKNLPLVSTHHSACIQVTLPQGSPSVLCHNPSLTFLFPSRCQS